MKSLLALLMAGLMLLSTAVAEEEGFDNAALEATEGCYVFLDDNQVDTIVRPMDQPYMGKLEAEDTQLIAYLDYAQMPDLNATFLRLTLSAVMPQMLAASEMSVTVGKTEYVFEVMPVISEYDTTYYEDYRVCMTGESLPMIKAMAQSGQDVFPVRLVGGIEVSGSMTIPASAVKAIYQRYIDLGGDDQDLSRFDEEWPVSQVQH